MSVSRTCWKFCCFSSAPRRTLCNSTITATRNGFFWHPREYQGTASYGWKRACCSGAPFGESWPMSCYGKQNLGKGEERENGGIFLSKGFTIFVLNSRIAIVRTQEWKIKKGRKKMYKLVFFRMATAFDSPFLLIPHLQFLRNLFLFPCRNYY